MSDMRLWMENLGLDQYVQVLIDNDIDFQILSHLSDADLKELGLSLGHRRKLLLELSDKNAIVETATPFKSEDPATVSGAEVEVDRRQLTVLFCDLVGSTELSQKLDPEELRDVFRNYHDTVVRSITDQNGHVAKLLGDGVLAYFGWPSAQENQVEMAVRTGLNATSAVSQIMAAGEPLAARVGIATGQVVVGDMMSETVQERGAVSGETPNLASRLQGQAQPGETVIDYATQRLIKGSFELQDGGLCHLKGFAEPVKIWRVMSTIHLGSRFEAAHDGQLTSLVGREHEIGLVLDRWRSSRDGEGQVVLISGEAGIGKSHILSEFAARLDGSGHLTLKLQCSQHETNTAFQPVLAEIESSAAFQPSDALEVRVDKLHDYLSLVFNENDEAISLITTSLSLPNTRYAPLHMAPQRQKQRTVMALVERISLLSRKQPIVLLIEDIHWIDPSSLEVLDALVEQVRDLPVLIVMTHRPNFLPQWGAHSHVTAHSLNRLSRSDGKAISEQISGGKALPDVVLSRILQQTDGIPLFVEELTKTVLEAGFLEERADSYVLNGPLPDVAIPTTLHDSLMARLDRMAPVKRVIQAAACIGREFGASLLATALPMSAEELKVALDQLLAAQLIFRRGSMEDESYIFKHALVQDAAYASLLISARQSLHNRLAQALERTDDPDPLTLARHFSASGANERAANLYLTAGRRSLESSALLEAIGALDLGLQALGAILPSRKRDRMELDLRVILGVARMANFGWAHPSVAEALEPAFPLAKAFANPDALGSILWGLWVHFQTRTDFPRAHEWLSELKTVARVHKKSDLPLIYDMSAGCQYFWEADYSSALGHTDHLKSIYDPNKHTQIATLVNHDPLCFSQHWAGSLAEWITGYPDSSVERMEEAISHARKVGHPFNLVFALTAGATNLIYLGDTDRLLKYCDEASKVVAEEALGPFADHVCVMQWRGAAHNQREEFKIGHSLIKTGNEFWTMSGGRICTAMFRSWIALGLQGLGRINEASAIISDNIIHCRETGDCYMEPECLRIQGELELKTDNPGIEAAERLFREAISIAQTQGAKSWELRAAMSLARLLHSRDRRSDAANCLEPVLNWFIEGLETEDIQEARNLMAVLS